MFVGLSHTAVGLSQTDSSRPIPGRQQKAYPRQTAEGLSQTDSGRPIPGRQQKAYPRQTAVGLSQADSSRPIPDRQQKAYPRQTAEGLSQADIFTTNTDDVKIKFHTYFSLCLSCSHHVSLFLYSSTSTTYVQQCYNVWTNMGYYPRSRLTNIQLP
jgi:hypothetical protein